MKRGMLIGLIAGGIVLVLLWYVVLFSPTSSDLKDTRDQVEEAQAQQQELENSVRRLQALSENNVAQQAELQALRAAVPENPDLGEFILAANEIATASGIQWLSISPKPPAAGGGSGPNSTIALSMQVEGGFFQLLDYLNRLEDLQRLVIIDSVTISSGEVQDSGTTGDSSASSGSTSSTPSDPTLSVTLSGRMFTNAEPATDSGSSGGTTSGGTTTPTTPPVTTSPGGNS
jgi:Tfp pilus assembly protein PilO